MSGKGSSILNTLSRKLYLLIVFFWGISIHAFGQQIITGKVLDDQTKEPLTGAYVVVPGTTNGTLTDVNGRFRLQANVEVRQLEISFMGYENILINIEENRALTVALRSKVNNLQQIVITANKEAALRTECPVAISKISQATIQETKPVLIAELINKVPGVVMQNLNNEQHGMSIRQPMGTSAYFLYMEDGIPVRPMGVFNHNALIEMNVFAISNIEVVKGPASSLYGPEAVGGAINFITHKPTAVPTARISIQGDQWGYQRLQYGGGGMITKKLGIYVSGFEARQRDGWQTYSDYDKSSFNARIDYSLTTKTRLTFSFAGNEYYSDMSGSVDSIAHYNREYTSTTDFSYRKVHSQRTRLSAEHQWNKQNETVVTLFYRDNFIEQNPNYAIRWTTGSTTATGEINRNSFFSKGAMLQHSMRFSFMNSRLLAGGTVEKSPTDYWAYRVDLGAQLRPDGMSVEKYTIIEERPDLFLAKYKADLTNSSVYSQFEFSPLKALKVTMGIRYDCMSFDYLNYLDQSSGSKSYEQVTPKIGATYSLTNDIGFYANYSKGFSPPGLTSIFRKRPSTDPYASSEFYYNLESAHFDNIETGGWASLLSNKIYIDLSVYQMRGHKELLNIRQPDNSFDYQSAGMTVHRGIEYSATYKPGDQWFVRVGGTNALHRFEECILSTVSTDVVKDVNGKEMPQAPRWIMNNEVTYKPNYVKGLRLSLEFQHIGAWYQNQVNTVKYQDRGMFGIKGVTYGNFRAGYTWRTIEVFTNIMNITDELYAHSATRGNAPNQRTSFTPAAPRTFLLGIQYSFSGKK